MALCKHGHAFSCAFDVKAENLGVQQAGSVKVRRGSPAAGACIGSMRYCCLLDRALRRACLPPGKNEAVWPSSPMPSTTTSSARVAASSTLFEQRHEAGLPWRGSADRPCCTSRALERGLVSATWRSSTSVTVTLSQVMGSRGQVFEEQRWRVAAETARVALPLRADGARQARWPPVGQCGGEALAAVENVTLPQSRGRHSCQVRPSRSISATAAEGPQVPDV